MWFGIRVRVPKKVKYAYQELPQPENAAKI
jgi:hypothetical protein